MIRPKTLCLYQIRTLFNLPHLSSQFLHELSTQHTPLEPIRSSETETEDHKQKLKKHLMKLEAELRKNGSDSTKETSTLETFFTEAVGLSEKCQNEESEKGLKKLSSLFSGAGRKDKLKTECKKEDELKELSADMAEFANYLHTKGYFGNANFVADNNKFDVYCFVNSYGRDYLKFAAEEFGKDHREIYKWLPTADLKKVAQFGCPSLGRKNVFSAKTMRFCFGIREETVCNKCVLKESCKFANQSVWKKGAKNMDLAVVMRVITLYGLPTRFEVPGDVRAAVNRLLKEVIRLSETES
ncbi:hypothetical protein HanHA300_Chr13g0466791 [Helianthus annuus]|nr:hypothetical protein HanHA300_Chr13g0466791 [Helianthus annuus]KAJ0662396.1 hypothetical protein HanLR1_Chr13g0468961 [Helianthus annuus]KAJ0669923.1 hypothetical protein HanOQP8_Chr13g0468051 [Helianthus annuus]